MKEECARSSEILRASVPGARWVPSENLHLTLAFLGHVDDARIPDISDAIARAVAGLVDFPAHVEGLGAFPSPRRARVLWAGLADPAGGLAAVATAVTEAMEAIGFPRERRAFTAHVTLARMDPPGSVDLAAVAVEPVRFTVDRVTLFQSHLGRPAPRYEALATFPFRREAAPPRPD